MKKIADIIHDPNKLPKKGDVVSGVGGEWAGGYVTMDFKSGRSVTVAVESPSEQKPGVTEKDDALAWVRSNCKFAAMTKSAQATVDPNGLQQAAQAGVSNWLRSMGGENENIEQDLKEATASIIQPSMLAMNGTFVTMSEQLTKFFQEKTQERTPAPTNVQQAVTNPFTPPPTAP